MEGKQRKFKNLLIAPRFQLRLCMYYAVSGFVFLAVVVAFALNRLMTVQALMNEKADMDFFVQTQVNDLMLQTVQVSLLGFVSYIAFTSLFALVISHRIAGPAVAIQSVIESLKAGNYDIKRRLRPSDELQEIMSGLHDLAVVLDKKDPSDTGN